MTRILVAGASGLIGGHLVKRLLNDGHHVRAVGRKIFSDWLQLHPGAENIRLDLSEKANCYRAAEGIGEIYNLAAEIGGVQFIEGQKALTMLSVLINTHLLMAARDLGAKRFFYSSAYAVEAALTEMVGALEDGHVWEKIFSEKLLKYFWEDFGVETRIGRLQNVYGSPDRYRGGRERAPAALCRKVIEAKQSGTNAIEIWGDGKQTRNFLHADDCAAAIQALMASGITEPVRIGSPEVVTINELIDLIEEVAGVKLERKYNLTAPTGAPRKLDLLGSADPRLQWEPKISLREGMARLYHWIVEDMGKMQSQHS